MNFFVHIKRLDWIVVGTSIALCAIGLVSLYSSSIAREDFGNFQKQIVFLGIGLCAMLFVSLVDYRLVQNNPYFLLTLYLLGVIALFGLFFFAPTIRGIQGWYRIGGISVDPIEFVKLVLALLLAKYFAWRHVELYRFRHILFTGIYVGIPVLLIARQPDLGSASILVMLWIVTLFVAGIKPRHIFIMIMVGTLAMSGIWAFGLQEYQKNRVVSFLEPELDPLGIGWSQHQSKIAIGNGGLFGQGLGKGTQTQYGFLSEPQTDFIFAAIAEEFGFAAIVLVFLLFLVLLWRILKIGKDSGNNFTRLFTAGIATIFIAHTFVNVGMNLGLLPIVGLPLPLVSYGGSSLILTYIGLGVLQSIKTH
jgi:rod shape determining protein RodA